MRYIIQIAKQHNFFFGSLILKTKSALNNELKKRGFLFMIGV